MKKHNLIFILLLLNLYSIAQVNSSYHYVEGHTRSNGVYVRGYYRTNSNETNLDNYSTKPNINPWTGEAGYIEPETYYIQNISSVKENEYISKEYNFAKELNDKRNYIESIISCKEAIIKFSKPILSRELLGWNYLALGENSLALEAFQQNMKDNVKSPYSASILYLTYLINNDTQKAEKLKSKFNDEKLIGDFTRYLNDNLLRLNLMVGVPNEEILKLILDNESLYLDNSLVMNTYPCVNCKFEFISDKLINVGEGIHKKRFNLKDDIQGSCIAVEIECPMKFRNSITDILYSLNFGRKQYIEYPLIRKKNSTVPKSILAEIHIRKKNNSYSGIMIYDLDLDGEANKDYFTIVIRK